MVQTNGNCWCGYDDPIQASTCGCQFIECWSVTITKDVNDITICGREYNVVSPDDSISVNTVIDWNVTTFEIEKDCCDDRFVWACPADTS